jgi:hypothetical protein
VTSSYCYAQVRVRRFGEPALFEPSWPDGCGAMPEYSYGVARQIYDEVGVLDGAEKKAFSEERYTSHGKPPVVYKELVLMECGSRTFGRKTVSISECKGDPSPTTVEIAPSPAGAEAKPLLFKDPPDSFKSWWARHNERLGDLLWSAFMAGRELGRTESKTAEMKGAGHGD